VASNVALFVTDTHSLAWYFTGSSKLGIKALQAFRASSAGKTVIIVPTIVLAEIMDISEKKRIKIDYQELVNRIEDSSNFETYPLDIHVLKTARSIAAIPELHDRIIVATARLLEARVLTHDENLQKSGLVEVVW
jgi:PIN domain nuclease of toxin-antitoxin system